MSGRQRSHTRAISVWVGQGPLVCVWVGGWMGGWGCDGRSGRAGQSGAGTAGDGVEEERAGVDLPAGYDGCSRLASRTWPGLLRARSQELKSMQQHGLSSIMMALITSDCGLI